ncbi:glycosyltransferase [Flavobacterium facile]|uniref:glycosyltransferase n=1 Tax=Flavobacterium facile TaxID=2893174 RepID=UPI002E796415|nr:glycosyltransferase [Flavobacterium sp. T-12]
MKLLYLYSEIMGYNVPTINILAENYCSEINVISWKKKISNYQIEKSEKVNYFYKEDFNKIELVNFVNKFSPNLVVVSGWMDKEYLEICKDLKNKGVTIVGAMDTQWKNTIRQKIATIIAPFYHKKYFDHLWVSGIYQFEYAKRLGFSNENIIFNCYSANTNLLENNKMEVNDDFKTLLFIGRFDKVKGIDILLNVFTDYINETKSKLKLKLIGGGIELDIVKKHESDAIIVKEFIQPEHLLEELKDVQGFILPSISEPWGVVIHEMAAAGLPLLVSNVCGANSVFAINNYNSFVFMANDKMDLRNAIEKFDLTSNSELIEMGKRSKVLSKKINPETSAASLMSINLK